MRQLKHLVQICTLESQNWVFTLNIQLYVMNLSLLPKTHMVQEFVTVKTSIKTDFKRLESWRGWLVERRELRDNGGEFLGNRIVHVLQGFLPLSVYNRIPYAICPNCQNVNRVQNVAYFCLRNTTVAY